MYDILSSLDKSRDKKVITDILSIMCSNCRCDGLYIWIHYLRGILVLSASINLLVCCLQLLCGWASCLHINVPTVL